MKTSLKRHRAFSLAELLVVVLCIGLLTGPLLAYLVQVQAMHHRLGEQGRAEAWKSLEDQALLEGIDPAAAPALAAGENPAVPAGGSRGSSRVASRLSPLLQSLQSPAGEGRPGGAGWEITASPVDAPARIPPLPAPSRTMRPPGVSPAPGATIPVTQLGLLSPAGILLSVSSEEGGRVVLRLSQPEAQLAGLGSLDRRLGSAELLLGVRGSAWAEFNGNAASGDKPALLADGRTLWTTTLADGRLQQVKPSAPVAISILVDLGGPVLSLGDRSWPSGETVPVDAALRRAVLEGISPAAVTWPESVRAILGPGGCVPGGGFTLRFSAEGSLQVPSIAALFADDLLEFWVDESVLVATPLLPEGCVAAGGRWVLRRDVLELSPPELASTPPAEAGIHEPGAFAFELPPGQAGAEGRGRISARSGTIVSPGPRLELRVEP